MKSMFFASIKHLRIVHYINIVTLTKKQKQKQRLSLCDIINMDISDIVV